MLNILWNILCSWSPSPTCSMPPSEVIKCIVLFQFLTLTHRICDAQNRSIRIIWCTFDTGLNWIFHQNHIINNISENQQSCKSTWRKSFHIALNAFETKSFKIHHHVTDLSHHICVWWKKLCHFNRALALICKFLRARAEYTKLYLTANGGGWLVFFLLGKRSQLSTISSPIGTNAPNVFNARNVLFRKL